MTDFKATQAPQGSNLAMTFAGSIDEDVQFPAVSGTFTEIHIDLKAVKSINSVGIREWLNWVKPLSEKSKIVLLNTPKALVFQLNMVEGFLPASGSVASFYVPFFCEKCDKEENVLFNVGKEFTASAGNYKINFDLKSAGLCKDAACELEMDATESKYFQFLKRMA